MAGMQSLATTAKWKEFNAGIILDEGIAHPLRINKIT
jgi:hypothetical protein